MSALVHGLPELLAKLQDIDAKVRNKALRAAVTKGARRVAKSVKQRVPKRTGKLKKAIASRVRKIDADRFEGRVGAKRGGRALQLLEFGTVGRIQKTQGVFATGTGFRRPRERRVGYVPANPVLRAALNEIAPHFSGILAEEVQKVL